MSGTCAATGYPMAWRGVAWRGVAWYSAASFSVVGVGEVQDSTVSHRTVPDQFRPAQTIRTPGHSRPGRTHLFRSCAVAIHYNITLCNITNHNML